MNPNCPPKRYREAALSALRAAGLELVTSALQSRGPPSRATAVPWRRPAAVRGPGR